MVRSQFGTIQKTKTGHRGRYRRKGKTYYTPNRPTKTGVRADLTKAQALILDGTWIDPKQASKEAQDAAKQARVWTVSDWYEEWYSSQQKAHASPNSLRAYSSIFRVHILPTFGDHTLAEVTSAECKELYEAVMAYRAKTTAQNVIRSFSAMMSAAVEDGKLETNPVKVKGAMVKSKRRKDVPIFSPAELSLLIKHMPEDTRAAGALGSWCSLRYGEVAPLMRKNILIAERVVRVRNSVKRAPKGTLSVGLTKSEAGERDVSIPPEAWPHIEHHLGKHVGPSRDALLFYRPRGPKGYLSDRVLRRDVQLACEAAGLPRVTFHDLRHIGLTLFGRAGATTADLMERAGHGDPATVQIYQHSSALRDRELADRMGSI